MRIKTFQDYSHEEGKLVKTIITIPIHNLTGNQLVISFFSDRYGDMKKPNLIVKSHNSDNDETKPLFNLEEVK